MPAATSDSRTPAPSAPVGTRTLIVFASLSVMAYSDAPSMCTSLKQTVWITVKIVNLDKISTHGRQQHGERCALPVSRGGRPSAGGHGCYALRLRQPQAAPVRAN